VHPQSFPIDLPEPGVRLLIRAMGRQAVSCAVLGRATSWGWSHRQAVPPERAHDGSAAEKPATAGQVDGDGLARDLAGMVMSGAVSWCCGSPSASFGAAGATPPAVDSRVGKGQEPR
jgi:hypothetical protein